MEVAFAGPAKIAERVGSVDPDVLAGFDAEKLKAVFAEKPAVHRYPGSMAGRVQQLAQAVVDEWDGRADAIWTSGSPDGREVLRRLKALPGFGDPEGPHLLGAAGQAARIRG